MIRCRLFAAFHTASQRINPDNADGPAPEIVAQWILGKQLQITSFVRSIVGDAPCYCTYDIDFVDPTHAPGTGTPEIGGLTTYQAQALLRGLRGLNYIGADVVEVSPPFDTGGLTAMAGAGIAFEILCLLAESMSKK